MGFLATRADIPQLRALDTQQYGELSLRVDYDALVRSQSAFVARSGSRVVGSALVGRPPGFVTVSSLWIQPGDRRRGFARMLVRGIIDGLCSPAHSVCALNVRKENMAALSLYRSLGFAKTGELFCLQRS